MASVPYIPTPDPTDGERAQLYRYHLANIFLNQQELAQWYEAYKVMESELAPPPLDDKNPFNTILMHTSVWKVLWNPFDLLMAIPIMSLVKSMTPPEVYIPERQTNLTIEEIAAAYSAPSDLPDDTKLQNSSNPLDDSEPRPLITRTEVNHALEVLQLYVIQTAPSTAALPETSALIESITTLTNRMADLNMKRKQQSHLEKWLRSD
ncbi:hypothetical protein EV426DRAFT_721140 [Tirmania nivea]|nr:hypothetical protein EV426DRAFT_721140 [Tirmania nivea]